MRPQRSRSDQSGLVSGAAQGRHAGKAPYTLLAPSIGQPGLGTIGKYGCLTLDRR